jgi:cytochrome oxidase Cu insertion factor (SCO1/SenC/PrrC family)
MSGKVTLGSTGNIQSLLRRRLLVSYDNYVPNFEMPVSDITRAEINTGMAAPDFMLPEADGGTVQLSALRGQPLVLIFFRRDW